MNYDVSFKYIIVYLSIYSRSFSFGERKIIITIHALKRARQRNIAFPDQVYFTICTGRIKRFGKNQIKFIKKSQKGSIICVGEETYDFIIIKTIGRGK